MFYEVVLSAKICASVLCHAEYMFIVEVILLIGVLVNLEPQPFWLTLVRVKSTRGD